MSIKKIHSNGYNPYKRKNIVAYELGGSYRQNRSCLNKRTYATRKAAKAAAVGYKQRCGSPITFYRCPFCGEYHLTRKRINERKNNGSRESNDGNRETT